MKSQQWGRGRLLNQAGLKVDFIKKAHYITQEEPERKPINTTCTGQDGRCAHVVVQNSRLESGNALRLDNHAIYTFC